MNARSSLLLCLLLLASGTALAQRSGRPAIVPDDPQWRQYRGDAEFRDDRNRALWDAQVAADIDRLRREMRALRDDVRVVNAGRRMRSRIAEMQRDTEQLAALFQQHRIRREHALHRAGEIRAEIRRLRRALSGSRVGVGGSWR